MVFLYDICYYHHSGPASVSEKSLRCDGVDIMKRLKLLKLGYGQGLGTEGSGDAFGWI